jgi:hypothetical protein
MRPGTYQPGPFRSTDGLSPNGVHGPPPLTHDGVLPAHYRRDRRSWLIWGIIATVPLVAAIYVMVAKP